MIEHCKQMIKKRNIILGYVKKNFDELRIKADASVIHKYSYKVSGIGPYCPSLVYYIIHPALKKGKLMNSKSALSTLSNFTEFTLDDNYQPLRMRNYNKYGCDLSSYFFEDGEYKYSVPLFRYTNEDYGKSVYLYKTHNNNILEYAEIEEDFLYWEIYVYSNNDDNVICYIYEYTDHSINSIDDRLKNKFIEIVGEKCDLKTQTKDFELKQFRYDISIKKGKPFSIDEYVLLGDAWLINRKVR